MSTQDQLILVSALFYLLIFLALLVGWAIPVEIQQRREERSR